MKIFVLITGLLVSLYSNLTGQTRWSFEAYGGGVYNARLPLIIKQNEYPDIRISRAVYYSEPFIDPYYIGFRVSKWFTNQGVELEVLHHKLYLQNKPQEVQRFSLSHGFNIVTVNYARQVRKFIARAGLGPVFVNPENTIRGMKYPEEGPYRNWPGHVLVGGGLNVAVSRQIHIGKYIFINTEGKITAAMARSPIVNGHADVYNIAFHLILGPGLNLWVKEEKVVD